MFFSRNFVLCTFVILLSLLNITYHMTVSYNFTKISSFQDYFAINIFSVTWITYWYMYVTHLFVPITKFVSLKKARYDLTRFCSASLNYFFSWKKSNIPIKLECLTKTDILLNSLTKVDLSSQLNTVK